MGPGLEIEAAVGSSPVVVFDGLAKPFLQMTTAEHKAVIQAVVSDRAHQRSANAKAMGLRPVLHPIHLPPRST
jgi:hypothetical protein